jgi:sugar lactone lactonase YvrE
MPARVSLEPVLRNAALLAEGPRWDAAGRRLIWVDVEGCSLHVFDPAHGDRAVSLDARVGAAAPYDGDRLLVALAGRLVVLDLGDESVTTLARLPHGDDIRLNDGACDPDGRFWVGSMALDERPRAGALYRYADGVLDRVLHDVTLSNGLGWTADGSRMYYVDSLTYRIDLFDFDVASGELSGRRPFVELDREEGIPDGLALDDDGCIWVALWGGWSLRRYTPAGVLDRIVEVPTANVTACCFGGDDGHSLYVTTAAHGLTPEQRAAQPLAGSVFVADVGVGGPPARAFAG